MFKPRNLKRQRKAFWSAEATNGRHRFPRTKSGVALRFPPHSRTIALCLFVVANAEAKEIKHRFLAKDESRAQLHYVDQLDASKDWTIKLEKGCRDIRLLDNHRVLVSHADGYAEFDLATQQQVHEVRDARFKKTETVSRLPNGNTILGANQKGITFFEIAPDGAVVRQVNFPQFNTMRLMRLSPEGRFLFGANTDHVIEADWDGAIHADIQVPGAKHIYWIRKMDAHYRVSTGYGKSIVDVSPQGEVLRTLGGTDDYFFFSRPFELANGNTVCCNWTGHKPNDSEKAPQLVEFDPQGNVVWNWHDPQRAGTIHGVIVLD
ncbi:hypothetical protein PDESU_03143 [Pontiella desulfatans]|uniref:Uncharacterized protein n=1 Tax=Pontiella desulfatans TaxID=2750659 RepID=A0A6C2U3K0_PONDE|nr:hypothetical protein [Pontiella desulfatans]VGO14580.1 hypothetical protein PDESU_03143 [Pontiella desulfatans]